jgi:hypothetical protein
VFLRGDIDNKIGEKERKVYKVYTGIWRDMGDMEGYGGIWGIWGIWMDIGDMEGHGGIWGIWRDMGYIWRDMERYGGM